MSKKEIERKDDKKLIEKMKYFVKLFEHSIPLRERVERLDEMALDDKWRFQYETFDSYQRAHDTAIDAYQELCVEYGRKRNEIKEALNGNSQ